MYFIILCSDITKRIIRPQKYAEAAASYNMIILMNEPGHSAAVSGVGVLNMDNPNQTAVADPVPATEKQTNAPKKPKKKRTAAYYAGRFFLKLGITAAVLWILLTFVAGVFICHTNSAYPSIKDGDFCLTWRLAKPEQGTMIAYRHDGELRFGRVIAFGGDKVSIFTDFITVNDYGISDETVYPTSPEGSAVNYPYIVPDNCVFVLNDYRSDLSDSRTFGGIPSGELRGAVVFTMRMRGI